MTPRDEEPRDPSGTPNVLDTPCAEILRLQDELERWLDLPGTMPIPGPDDSPETSDHASKVPAPADAPREKEKSK